MTDIVKIASCLTDRPLIEEAADYLEITRYANGLCDFILKAETPITIGIQGGWGSGKTSLMNLLKSRLMTEAEDEFNGTVCLDINAWEQSLLRDNTSGCEVTVNFLQSLMDEMLTKLTEASKQNPARFSEDVRKEVLGEKGFIKKAMSILKAFTPLTRTAALLGLGVIGGYLAGETGAAVGQSVAPENGEKKADEKSLVQNVQKLRKNIDDSVKNILDKTIYNRFVIFIDDLDRIQPENAVNVLDMIKNMFDTPGCVFILAIDYDVVVKGLKGKFGEKTEENDHEFRQYFDKIIQIPFHMPVGAYDNSMENLLATSLGKILNIALTDSKVKENMKNAAICATDGIPRSVKRIINTLSLLQFIKKNKGQIDEITLEIDFIIIAININFPEISKKLMGKNNFTKWTFAEQGREWGLEENDPSFFEKFSKEQQVLFNEEWEQITYHLCQKNTWLQSKYYGISRILNCLRNAFGRKNNKVTTLDDPYDLTEEDAEHLREIFDQIRVVSVDDSHLATTPISNTKIKDDAFSVFCRGLHGLLMGPIPELKDLDPSMYATRPQDGCGSRSYALTLKKPLFETNVKLKMEICWEKEPKLFLFGARITPFARDKKKKLTAIRANASQYGEDTRWGNDYFFVPLKEISSDKDFASEDPSIYVNSITKYFNWLRSVAKIVNDI
ncbi:MAG: KAP family NTPase [Deltaproteobacteria bacterium]|jgi:hypothetical protein|nr:KAP family NTPase [Deltaproteobacteria bacterium]